QISLAALIVAAAAALAAADEIQLTNGHKLTGNVSKKDAQKVTIEVGAGTITLDAKEVSTISPGATALNEYDARWKELHTSTKAPELYELLVWAKSKGLTRYVGPLAAKIISIDPEHAGARAELRHEKVGGKWLTFEQAQEARGLVLVDDRWVTKAEIQLMERRRLEAKEHAEAAEEARKQHREEERQARQAAVDAYNAQLQAAMSQMDGYFYSPSFCFSPYYRPNWWAPYLRSRNFYQHGWMYNSGGYSGLNWGGLILR
ncbi:MAG TPA: hypothetical protein VG457_08405, partial [Planctomycetota bacterium]|nr:hypothetical protein [Planctomycetota bacterium]